MPDAEPSEPKPTDAHTMTGLVMHNAVTCLCCGCLCDDLTVTTSAGRATAVRNACGMGEEWFLRDRARRADVPLAQVTGQTVGGDEAVGYAADLLMQARSPVILGLERSTNETVAAAVRLADRVGAFIEPGDGLGSAARIVAFQRAGRVSATLGEVKNRADVVVFWRADPAATHPRHGERYSIEPRGRFVPDGRSDRTIIVVDTQRTATAELADHFITIAEEHEFEVLWTLRTLGRGTPISDHRIRAATGCDPDELRALSARLTGARYGALFRGTPETGASFVGATAAIEALSRLVRDLNRTTRFVMIGLGGPGNPAGAEAVLTWQTGFPSSVDLSAGHPRSLPGAATAASRLARGEFDLAMIVGELNLNAFPTAARSGPRAMPLIVIAAEDQQGGTRPDASVWLRAATPGLEEAGTVIRVDGVALPLRTIVPSIYPGEREWIDRICNLLAATGARARPLLELGGRNSPR